MRYSQVQYASVSAMAVTEYVPNDTPAGAHTSKVPLKSLNVCVVVPPDNPLV
jgi:hypothetical protein